MAIQNIDEVFERLPEAEFERTNDFRAAPLGIELVEITNKEGTARAGYVFGKLSKGNADRWRRLYREDCVVMGNERESDGRVSPVNFNTMHLDGNRSFRFYEKSQIESYDVLKTFG